MVDIYGEIIDKAVKLMKKPYTSKDLVNIANVTINITILECK